MMTNQENRLIEDIWYYVKIREEYHYRPPIKVEDKFYFVGKLIVHVGNQLIFNLQDDKGSVVLPFELVEWMVPFYKNPERSWLDDL